MDEEQRERSISICADFHDLHHVERSLDAALDAVAYALLMLKFQNCKIHAPSRFADVRSHLLRAIETIRAALDDCNPVLPMDRTFCEVM